MEQFFSNLVKARFRKGDFFQEQRFGLLKFRRRDRRCSACRADPFNQIGRKGHIGGMAGIEDLKGGTGLPHIEQGFNGVNQPGLFPEIAVEPGGIEGAGQDIIP